MQHVIDSRTYSQTLLLQGGRGAFTVMDIDMCLASTRQNSSKNIRHPNDCVTILIGARRNCAACGKQQHIIKTTALHMLLRGQ